jgi:hypothetical protein
MATKQQIIQEKLERYIAAQRQEKGRILDALVEATGFQRDAIIRRLRTLQSRPAWWKDNRGGARIVYGPDVTAALKDVWETASCIGAERLQPAIERWVRILQRDRMWKHGEEATKKLLRMSLGTMKGRVASFDNERGRKGIGSTIPSMLKEIIPIRRGPWENPKPGFGEIDTVAHCGTTLLGDFGYTVQYTDVTTIWTALCAQWNKSQEATRASMERIRSRLPFPLLGIDPDSGSEFINWLLKSWCDMLGIVMTRIRPGKKNDHARIEQKNYANVRKFIGYGRITNGKQVAILNDYYETLEDYLNFFIPSQKCIEKKKIGSKIKRMYDTPKTAYQRVLEHPDIASDVKEKLRQKYETLNPKVLKDRLDAMMQRLLRAGYRL